MTYKVHYEGFYIIEADSEEEALATNKDDYEVEYEEWTNTECEEYGQ